MQNKNFTGYVLAGGKSSRMGSDKALLEIGGKTFLENAIDALRPHCSTVKIILNRSQNHFIEKLTDQIPNIFDIYENRGALGGIHTAFKNCKTEFAIILAVDLPFVSSQAIEKLSEIALAFNEFSAFVPRQNDGKLQPLCAIYRTKDCLSEIENFLETEKSASVKSFLNKIPIKIVEQEIFADKKDIFFNVNNPRDFQELQHNLK
ncbi:molybdenum cofactor guanylyltransferase [soil metagenome]